MKARTKFLMGGAVVLGTVGFLMFNSIQADGAQVVTPGQLLAKRAEEPSFATKRPVQVGANVVPGTYQRSPNGMEHSFRAAVAPDTLRVKFSGIVPDTFKDSVDLLMEGVLDNAGTFQASSVVTKCASRYEVAPTGPGSPGVKGAVGSGYSPAPTNTAASADSNRT
jgi:cytochrome c-type biogenesis protein CcmE